MHTFNDAIRSYAMTVACTIVITCVFSEMDAQQPDRTVKDRDGNSYAFKTMLDNKQWLTANLNLNIEGSFCYGDLPSNCQEYGRLYTWETAKKACPLLGEGWRLPTDEEWQQMASHYGGVFNNSTDSGKTAFKSLLHPGPAGFNALLGGGSAPDSTRYKRLQGHGFYWTATESDTAHAWFYNFGKGRGMLFRQPDGEKFRAFSVRCISDPAHIKK